METKSLMLLGIPKDVFSAIRSRTTRASAEEIFDWGNREGCRFILRGTPGYPALLEEVFDAPLILYARGQLKHLGISNIAVVGSRRPTVYGLQTAHGIASDLGSRGICIVSGLARGIDAAAHRGCMEGGGKTVAVLGSGIDIIYPREHRRLSEEILKTGLLLSEFPPGTPPAPHNFPIRNRIISGLSLGSLIVEANENSGSLITARLALEQDREVFAIPGNITSPKSCGPNFLIKQGAKLVQSWKDVVDEMPGVIRDKIYRCEAKETIPALKLNAGSEEENKLLSLLRLDEATQFDKLYHDSGLNIADLSDRLMNLEMEGRVRRLPGNVYIRTEKHPSR